MAWKRQLMTGSGKPVTAQSTRLFSSPSKLVKELASDSNLGSPVTLFNVYLIII